MEKDRSLYGDRKRDQEKVDISSVDSPINTAPGTSPDHSLTPDDSGSTDPTEVRDKPSFDHGDSRTGRFDGQVDI